VMTSPQRIPPPQVTKTIMSSRIHAVCSHTTRRISSNSQLRSYVKLYLQLPDSNEYWKVSTTFCKILQYTFYPNRCLSVFEPFRAYAKTDRRSDFICAPRSWEQNLIILQSQPADGNNTEKGISGQGVPYKEEM
jgi:hypothetical protein